MKTDKKFKEIEMICKNERIMEKHYGVENFTPGDRYFTTSQEADIMDMISDGLEVNDIIKIIRKW